MTSVLTALRRRTARVPVSILIVGLIIAVIVAAAILAPWIAPADPDRQVLLSRLKPPGTVGRGDVTFLLGTDDLGRDLLSRILYGARVSLGVAALSVVVSKIGRAHV